MNMAKLTPLKAIRVKCLDCSCGSAHEVRECPIEKCPLSIYRMGGILPVLVKVARAT